MIIAAYNAAAYISRAITSAITQAGTTLKVIVVDDGFTDDTVDLVRALAATGPVRCIKTERNGGPGEARNLGLRSARGAWIAILDADDAFEPGRLRTLIDLARSWSAEIVSDNRSRARRRRAVRRLDVFLPSGRNTRHFRGDGVRQRQYCLTRPHAARLGFMRLILNRDLIDRAGLRYRTSWLAEDYLFGLDALCAVARRVVTPQALYVYTLRPGSL